MAAQTCESPASCQVRSLPRRTARGGPFLLCSLGLSHSRLPLAVFSPSFFRSFSFFFNPDSQLFFSFTLSFLLPIPLGRSWPRYWIGTSDYVARPVRPCRLYFCRHSRRGNCCGEWSRGPLLSNARHCPSFSLISCTFVDMNFSCSFFFFLSFSLGKMALSDLYSSYFRCLQEGKWCLYGSGPSYPYQIRTQAVTVFFFGFQSDCGTRPRVEEEKYQRLLRVIPKREKKSGSNQE